MRTRHSGSLKTCNLLEESCGQELKNSLLLQSGILMIKPFWTDASVELNVLEIAVKSEWITSWLWCATFINPHRTLAAQCQSVRGEVAAGDGSFSLKHQWEESQRHKSIFPRPDENSQSFQAGCLKKFGRLFSAISHPECPLFLPRIPHSHGSFWVSLSHILKPEKLQLVVCSREFGNILWLWTQSSPGVAAFCFVPH